MLNIKNPPFNAAGDNTTDDTSAIQAVLDYIETNGADEIIIPKGEYKVDGAISKVLTKDVSIVCEPGAVINGTNSTAETLINITGKRVSNTPLIGNAVKFGDNILADASWVSDLKHGDMILISSTELWNPTRTNYRKGEIVEVSSTNGTSIILKHPLYDSYNALTTTLHKLCMPNIKVKGLKINRNSNHAGLNISYARDLLMDDVYCTGARECGLRVSYINFGVIRDCGADDCWYNGTLTSYGLGIGSSMTVRVINGRYEGGRHGVSSGGWEPCRDLLYDGCTVSNYTLSGQAAFDAHGDVENLKVVNCRISNGLAVQSTNTVIENNDIILSLSNVSNYAIAWLGEVNSEYTQINNNRIWGGKSTTQAMAIIPLVSNLHINYLSINDNIVNSPNVGVYIRPYSSSITGFTIDTFNFNNNRIVTDASYAFSMYNNGAAGITVNNFIARDNKLISNSFRSGYINVDNTTGELYFDKCVFSSGKANDYAFIVNSAYDAIFNKCTFKGDSSPYPICNVLKTSNKLELIDCKLNGFNQKSGLDLSAEAIPTVIIRNLKTANTVGEPAYNSNSKVITDKGSGRLYTVL